MDVILLVDSNVLSEEELQMITVEVYKTVNRETSATASIVEQNGRVAIMIWRLETFSVFFHIIKTYILHKPSLKFSIKKKDGETIVMDAKSLSKEEQTFKILTKLDEVRNQQVVKVIEVNGHAFLSGSMMVDSCNNYNNGASKKNLQETIEKEHLQETIEAFAIARIKDYESKQFFYINQTYILQAGIVKEVADEFKSVSINLPDKESIQFDIVVYAEDMEIKPEWKQPYTFYRDKEPSFVDFELIPTKTGHKHIRVEFLYQLHWLAKIEFSVEIVNTCVDLSQLNLF